jgi:hypothetical protein
MIITNKVSQKHKLTIEPINLRDPRHKCKLLVFNQRLKYQEKNKTEYKRCVRNQAIKEGDNFR